jgi:c-di-AMP phosphodiesterase-like protein
MKADNFSLLDRVRKLSKDTEIYITLSIGFAYDFPDDVVKLNEMANSAIDIAVSRGGDQVVVNQYGEELAFYGGRTQSAGNAATNVKAALADALIGLIKNAASSSSWHMPIWILTLGLSLGSKPSSMPSAAVKN